MSDTLSAVLSDFARTLLTDFSVQTILDHLVERIVEVLPVSGVGITLISPGDKPRYVAASDDVALVFERLQSELGQGPCITAYQSGAVVAVPDLDLDDRYPLFGPAARSAGMAAVFTFPLRDGTGRMGALDLYSDRTGSLTGEQLDEAQTLADVAAAYLLNAQARDEAREAADRFRHHALHDALTGLPNRALLHERLEHAERRARRSQRTSAVLFVDLDRFKRINDTYGHSVGDELLVEVARRLSELVRPGDTLARISGDEFVVLCEDLSTPHDAQVLAERLQAAFRTPFLLSGTRQSLTASVGIACSRPGEPVTDQLVIDADVAMYQAKRKGGAVFETLDLLAARVAVERTGLEQDLLGAVDDAELSVTYQPFVRMADRTVVGVEALLRWPHPRRGVVPAATTVALAEQSGLITTVGTWVLANACRDRGRWLAERPDQPLDVAVNVSPRQLMASGFPEAVREVLGSTGMDPAALVLEVTEGVFLEDEERARTVLSDLRALGTRIALDDFGTGYCSLGYLRRLPVDAVKIDRTFVTDIGRQPSGAAVVSAVTGLAHALGLAVTAEGVETQEEHDVVSAVGCELAQGFLYAPPTSPTRLLEHLSRPGGAGPT